MKPGKMTQNAKPRSNKNETQVEVILHHELILCTDLKNLFLKTNEVTIKLILFVLIKTLFMTCLKGRLHRQYKIYSITSVKDEKCRKSVDLIRWGKNPTKHFRMYDGINFTGLKIKANKVIFIYSCVFLDDKCWGAFLTSFCPKGTKIKTHKGISEKTSSCRTQRDVKVLNQRQTGPEFLLLPGAVRKSKMTLVENGRSMNINLWHFHCVCVV